MQSSRYEWEIAEREDGTSELWRFPTTRKIRGAIDSARRSPLGLYDVLLAETSLVPRQQRHISDEVEELRAVADTVFGYLRARGWVL